MLYVMQLMANVWSSSLCTVRLNTIDVVRRSTSTHANRQPCCLRMRSAAPSQSCECCARHQHAEHCMAFCRCTWSLQGSGWDKQLYNVV